MARLRMKKRKEKHGKHAVFFFYALYAYTFSFPKIVQIPRNKDREGLAIAAS